MANGKGSNRRPQQVDDKQVDTNWRETFGQTEPKRKPFALLRRYAEGNAASLLAKPEGQG